MKRHPEVEYLGLNAADTPDRARAFVEEFGWTWPSISDPERALAKRLGADYQPYFAAIDARGEVVAVHDGAGDAAVWSALLARLEE